MGLIVLPWKGLVTVPCIPGPCAWPMIGFVKPWVEREVRGGSGVVSGMFFREFRGGFGMVSGGFRGGFGEISGGFGEVFGRFRGSFWEVSE